MLVSVRGCLSDDEVLGVIEGTVTPAGRDSILAHADDCSTCRALLVAGSRGSADAPDDADKAVLRGANVGRYVVLELLGAGGMGEVHSAFDPALDRKVAIKLLHEDGQERSRLTREG